MLPPGLQAAGVEAVPAVNCRPSGSEEWLPADTVFGGHDDGALAERPIQRRSWASREHQGVPVDPAVVSLLESVVSVGFDLLLQRLLSALKFICR